MSVNWEQLLSEGDKIKLAVARHKAEQARAQEHRLVREYNSLVHKGADQAARQAKRDELDAATQERQAAEEQARRVEDEVFAALATAPASGEAAAERVVLRRRKAGPHYKLEYQQAAEMIRNKKKIEGLTDQEAWDLAYDWCIRELGGSPITRDKTLHRNVKRGIQRALAREGRKRETIIG